MDINFVKAFLQPELAILVAFVTCVGWFLKKAESIKDKYIPIILWVVGAFITIMWFGVVDGHGLTATVFINGVVQGTFVAALAVFGNQVYKQLKSEE